MAKWGEGDPRWIVEQRTDGTNVNNWHWTERDVSSWSSVLLRDLLLGVSLKGPEGVVELTEVDRLEGESSINNRRGKLFFFYEWRLRASWLGTSSSGVKFRGTVDVSNLSDENDMDDLDISVSLCKDQPDTPLLGLMKKTGVQEVRRVLGEFVRRLKSEFSQGMILAKADQPEPPEPQTQKNQTQTNRPQTQKNHIQTSRPQKSSDPRCSSGPAPSLPGVPIKTCSFNLTETFQTSPDELYRTFISQEVPEQTRVKPVRTGVHSFSCSGGRSERRTVPDVGRQRQRRVHTAGTVPKDRDEVALQNVAQ
ncbi:activator of 90 kDa heat shock protein ATPase homolog 1-like isoform X2 [Cebidichthys violaceus]|uniref:activator of 90 kDa heat shock protein ATPase homolog 1-like isoform X2 n=1 Tax=Cebidichthys violaceus TaxID=271503 RepID=UPI0035CC58B0